MEEDFWVLLFNGFEDYNQKNIEVKKELIVSLHTQYDNTQLYYDKIIARLKLLE